jgi:hypothetical protein
MTKLSVEELEDLSKVYTTDAATLWLSGGIQDTAARVARLERLAILSMLIAVNERLKRLEERDSSPVLACEHACGSHDSNGPWVCAHCGATRSTAP